MEKPVQLKRKRAFFPLGKTLFASVGVRKGVVKLYVKHYEWKVQGMKDMRVVPKGTGISLDMSEFKRLCQQRKAIKQLASNTEERLRGIKTNKNQPATMSTVEPENTELAVKTKQNEVPDYARVCFTRSFSESNNHSF